ncbi:hypothetical protein AX15_003870 [Amanita polypyramis BW_CC]|nr:hypothetical protein AX15_003870 [Amanita polypyramis BW_CC]
MDAISQIPRALVPHTCYSAIDSILKDLKIYSRRIYYALASHADELQLLQRIYYKSKNQHRGALFWRRLVEVCRYSKRLDDAKIFSVLEELRASFFGREAKQKCVIRKALFSNKTSQCIKPKTSQGLMDTCTPEKVRGEHPRLLPGMQKSIAKGEMVSEFRSQPDIRGFSQMQDRLLEAYRSFTLAMQSGAFVQLLLVVVAMTSRIRTLSIEVQEALSMATSSLEQFVTLDVSEELSSTILPTAPNTISPPPEAGRGTGGTSLSTEHDSTPMQQITSRVIVQRHTEMKQPVGNGTPGRRRLENVQKIKKVKAKKPRDEIDDIFLAAH